DGAIGDFGKQPAIAMAGQLAVEPADGHHAPRLVADSAIGHVRADRFGRVAVHVDDRQPEDVHPATIRRSHRRAVLEVLLDRLATNELTPAADVLAALRVQLAQPLSVLVRVLFGPQRLHLADLFFVVHGSTSFEIAYFRESAYAC